MVGEFAEYWQEALAEPSVAGATATHPLPVSARAGARPTATPDAASATPRPTGTTILLMPTPPPVEPVPVTRFGPLWADSCRFLLVRAAASKEGERSLRQHVEVERERPVLDIEEVVADVVRERELVAAVDLPQPGDPGLDLEPALDPLVVTLGLVGKRRTRANEAHVAAHHVPELGQLVEAPLAEHAAHG